MFICGSVTHIQTHKLSYLQIISNNFKINKYSVELSKHIVSGGGIRLTNQWLVRGLILHESEAYGKPANLAALWSPLSH